MGRHIIKTRDKIIYEALDLFSSRGYSDVTVENIAQRVGIKAPSIYKHFKSKDEIFACIIELVKENFSREIESIAKECSKEDELYIKLEKFGLQIFKYFLHDEFMSKARKMLSLEIYKNGEIMTLYIYQYITNPVEHHKDLINYLGIAEEDALSLAFAFYSPVYLALKICDSDPNKEEEMYSMLSNTYSKFNKLVHI